MAETKNYIIKDHEHGSIMISDEVIAAIALSALKDVEGFVSLTVKLSSDLSSLKNWNKAMKIVISDHNEISIDCSIVVAYGQAVITVAKNAQDAISAAVENMTGIKPACVNVNVCGIARQ